MPRPSLHRSNPSPTAIHLLSCHCFVGGGGIPPPHPGRPPRNDTASVIASVSEAISRPCTRRSTPAIAALLPSVRLLRRQSPPRNDTASVLASVSEAISRPCGRRSTPAIAALLPSVRLLRQQSPPRNDTASVLASVSEAISRPCTRRSTPAIAALLPSVRLLRQQSPPRNDRLLCLPWFQPLGCFAFAQHDSANEIPNGSALTSRRGRRCASWRWCR